MEELTSDRIRGQPFRNIKNKIDRIRVNNGNQSALSQLSSLSAATANNLAVRPFARTSFGQALMEKQVQHHKLNFNYGTDSALGPSHSSVERMRQKESEARKLAKTAASQGNKLYHGHNTMNTSFYSAERKIEQQAQITMN